MLVAVPPELEHNESMKFKLFCSDNSVKKYSLFSREN